DLHEVVAGDRAAVVDQGPNEFVDAAVVQVAHLSEFVVGGSAEHGFRTRSGLENKAVLDQVVQHPADDGFVVALEATEDGPPRHEFRALQVVVNGFPQGATPIGRALAEVLDLPEIPAKGHPEHVRAHLAAHALRIELARQVEEDLIGDVGYWRSYTAGR